MTTATSRDLAVKKACRQGNRCPGNPCDAGHPWSPRGTGELIHQQGYMKKKETWGKETLQHAYVCSWLEKGKIHREVIVVPELTGSPR